MHAMFHLVSIFGVKICCFVVKDLPLYKFSSKPVSLAYDSAQQLLAIGCDRGKIIMYRISHYSCYI